MVVYFECDMGRCIVYNVVSVSVFDYFELVDEYFIVELKVIEKMVG